MITKGFVTLMMITKIDDSFAGTFPEEVFENAKELGMSGQLKIGEDNNTTSKVCKRFTLSCRNCFKRKETNLESANHNFGGGNQKKLHIKNILM